MKNESDLNYDTFKDVLVKPLYDLAMLVPFDEETVDPYDMLEFVAQAARCETQHQTFTKALNALISFNNQDKYEEFRTVFDMCDTQGFFWQEETRLILLRLINEFELALQLKSLGV